MNFFNIFILVIFIGFEAGCSVASKEVYREGYQQGVHEQIKQIRGQFQGGNFPYFHWSSPIVQEVNIPAHLSNGVMIPAHDELVIIKPGEWSKNPSYPIKSQQRNKDDNQTIYMDVSNITALPSVGDAKQSND